MTDLTGRSSVGSGRKPFFNSETKLLHLLRARNEESAVVLSVMNLKMPRTFRHLMPRSTAHYQTTVRTLGAIASIALNKSLFASKATAYADNSSPAVEHSSGK